MTDIKTAKMAAAKAAVDLLQPGMVVGLGTGSTAAFFIELLSAACQEGLKIQAIASSKLTQQLAVKWQIPLLDPDEVTTLDLAVDGADEIDPQKRMVKGGGGALLREKIVASMSREMLVIVDSSKQVEALGIFPLPVEIIPFAYRATLAHLQQLGYVGTIRTLPDDSFFITDNGNYIYDLRLPFPCLNPDEDDRTICSIPGVVDTGFFLNMAGRVIVGYPDGSVEIQS
jgi:ribose 5-phosphate isomerase A